MFPADGQTISQRGHCNEACRTRGYVRNQILRAETSIIKGPNATAIALKHCIDKYCVYQSIADHFHEVV
jgi:hypothetical protein